MQLITIDWIIIASYFIISLLIGWHYRVKNTSNDNFNHSNDPNDPNDSNKSSKTPNSMEHFFLGGRNCSWQLAGISMVATTFAADTPLSVVELIAKNGIAGNWVWWSFLISGMVTTFFFAHLWQRSGVMTEGELIELRYSGRSAQILRGVKSFYLGGFMNILVIAWVNVAMISILEIFFGLNHQQAIIYTAIAMIITAGYSALSGLMGVVMTDAVQFVIAMFGCIILTFFVLNSEQIGGLSNLMNQLPSDKTNFFPTIQQPDFLWQTIIFLTVQWWASWYPGSEPGGGGYIAQRMMSTPKSSDAVKATLFFQLMNFCIRPWPWILVGLAGFILYPEVMSGDKSREAYVYAMKDFLPSGYRGLLLVAFLAAYMSTISTQLNWGVSCLLNDGYHRFLKPQATEKQLLNAARVLTLISGIAGLIATLFVGSISGVWTFLMNCGAGVGLVLILRWYWWRVNALSEIVAILTPFIVQGGFVIIRIASDGTMVIPTPFDYLVCVLITCITTLITIAITTPTEQKTLKQFYNQVKPQGFWGTMKHSEFDTLQNTTMKQKLIACISSILLGYALLFLMGYIFFNQMLLAGICVIVSIIGLYGLCWYFKLSAIQID